MTSELTAATEPARTLRVEPSGDVGTAAETERERLIALFSELVEPLGRALPISSEVVLHDLRRLPHSIVAVQGNVTGRRIGDPATDLLLERATAGTLDHMVGYATRLPDGRSLNSTTMVIRDSAGLPVAALCINSDLSMWESLGRVATGMTGSRDGDQPPDRGTDETGVAYVPVTTATESAATGRPVNEVFVHDVDELASHLIMQAIREQNVPVDLMRKEHKVEVVRSLQSRGMFQLRDAVETVASSLLVTRFTIYNYLNEISDQAGGGASRRAEPPATRRRS